MHKGQRRKLLEELRTMGIRDEAVLDAMDRVPRHYFLDSAFSQFAYSNKAFPIAAGQTISQPHTVAKQSELLGAAPGANVLEIGTGSGYQCAVLCALGLKVHSIERQKALFDTAGPLLKAMGGSPRCTTATATKASRSLRRSTASSSRAAPQTCPKRCLVSSKWEDEWSSRWGMATPSACGPLTALASANSPRKTADTRPSCPCSKHAHATEPEEFLKSEEVVHRTEPFAKNFGLRPRAIQDR